MAVNALNSGAQVWMADFEDATAPTWDNIIGGQLNLIDAKRREIDFTDPRGKRYALNADVATVVVRPRGWHLVEKHILVDGRAISASLVDFGLSLLHTGQLFYYLPKLEDHREARLWNDIFLFAQRYLGIAAGSIRATVLIETITAAFEMEEILYELREHAAGLNAGRWDYIFSTIKHFGFRPEFVFPDRAAVTMTVPFMRAYTSLLVQTCHRRGAQAIGGMSAFIPAVAKAEPGATGADEKTDEVALAAVWADKQREARDGFDGSWVAHPALVPICRRAFDTVKPEEQNTVVRAADLLAIDGTPGQVTEGGVRGNVAVALRYVDAWLAGTGATAINHLMEDAATAEIARCQLWQWIQHGTPLAGGSGGRVTADLVRAMLAEEAATLASGRSTVELDRLRAAAAVIEENALEEDLPAFFTTSAYARHLTTIAR